MATPGQALFDAQHTAPPVCIVKRKATVQLGGLNTIRYPGDLLESREAEWFESGTATSAGPRQPEDSHPLTKQNHLRFFIDGPSAFSAIEQAIQAATGDEDYAYMLNWWADPALPMPSGKRFADLLGEAKDRNVQIRGMFWKLFIDPVVDAVSWFGTSVTVLLPPWKGPRGKEEQNEAMVKFINEGIATVKETTYDPNGQDVEVRHPPQGRPTAVGAAIHDLRLNQKHILPVPISVGSHHQKILCLKSGGEIVAFCGGIDFNRDRIEMTRMVYSGAPLHDVHCEVRGPAARSLLMTFVDRWKDHPESAGWDAREGILRVKPSDLDLGLADSPGRHSVQMGRTFGGGELLGDPPPGKEHYDFAPAGEKTGRKLMLKAIRNARKFIYLEDQYFVNLEAAELLRSVLDQNNLSHVTIVLPHHEISDMPISVRHRSAAIKLLKSQHPDKVRVFYRCGPGQKPGDYHTYVHAKVTIVDDEFAVIGSTNYTRRSWTHDSEVCLGIYDPSSDEILTSRFAHWLRMRLWAEHLFGVVLPPTPPEQGAQGHDRVYAELFDGEAAGALWVRLIQLKQEWLAKNPNAVPSQPPFGGGVAAHPRDCGYDQSEQTEEPLAQVAQVRPYDEDDDPQEINAVDVPIIGLPLNAEVIWDEFIDPQG